MGMILRIASSRIVGQGDIVGRSGYFSLNLSANSVMRGRLDARRTLKSLVADLRHKGFLRLFYVYSCYSNVLIINNICFTCISTKEHFDIVTENSRRNILFLAVQITLPVVLICLRM